MESKLSNDPIENLKIFTLLMRKISPENQYLINKKIVTNSRRRCYEYLSANSLMF